MKRGNCVSDQTCPDSDDYADSKVDMLKGRKEDTRVNGGLDSTHLQHAIISSGVDSFHQHAIRIDDGVDDAPGEVR